MTITVTTLGTGSPLPDPHRAGPSTLIVAGSTRILIDAGRGVLMRLMSAGVVPVMLDAVLLTHLHSDHITDLNDVITTHWVMSAVPTPLRIYGPPGTRQVVDGIFAMLAADFTYRLDHHADLTWTPIVDVHEFEPPETVTIGSATITAQPTDHRPVEPTIGYRIEHDGAVAAIAGDTVPCVGLDAICAQADVYVQTVVRPDLVALVPSPRLHDILDYHSSVEQAAQTAAAHDVGILMCTHFVPSLQTAQADGWRELAAKHFDGEIVLADDLSAVTVVDRASASPSG